MVEHVVGRAAGDDGAEVEGEQLVGDRRMISGMSCSMMSIEQPVS